MPALAERFESALEQMRALRAERDAEQSVARVARDHAQLFRAELRATRVQSWLTRSASVDVVLRAIEFFGTYGRPREQVAGLILVDAFFRANGIVGWMATREPSAEEVRTAVDRVIASGALFGSAQLIAFLRFVVEATLRGEAHQINAYTIAVEALGREEHFDPQTDPIVRVVAGRLRRALKRYYVGVGATDTLLIHIPRDHYVPEFQWRSMTRGRLVSATGTDTTSRPASSTTRTVQSLQSPSPG